MQTEATPAQADVSELDLVKQCQTGDTQAFDQLVSRYRTRVFGMIYNMVRNEQDAWDLAQDSFVKGVEVDWPLPQSVLFLHLDLPDRDECHDRLAAQEAGQRHRHGV